MRRSGSAPSVRRKILLPFAVGALMLGAAVGGSAVLEARQAAVDELEKRALSVRRMFDGAIERSGQRALQDTSLLAERPSLGVAVERRSVVEFSREVIPFAIEQGYDVIAVLAPSGDELFVNGMAPLIRAAPARTLVRRGAFGVPGSTFAATGEGAIVVYASVPVRTARGIVGVVLVAHRLGPTELSAIATPLDAAVAVTRHGAGATPPSGVSDARSYSYAVDLGGSKATLHVFLSGADLSRATRLAVLAAAAIGLVFVFGLVLLVGVLLQRAVAHPVNALRSAIIEVGRGREDVRVSPDGARELQEVGVGFNTMIDALTAGTEFREGVMNATTDAILSVDLEGRLTLVNRRACELTGLGPDDLLGRPLLSLVAPSEAVRVRGLLAAVGGQAGPATLEAVKLLGKSETPTLVNMSCSSLSQGGRMSGVVLTARDVTEQLLLEHQLRQAQKSEAIGQLAGGIAHDFNNLMAGIIGYAELMLLERTPADPDHEPLTVIKRTGERAAELTRQLLAFSRQQVLKPKVIDLNAIVMDAEKLLTRLVGPEIELVTALERPLYAVEADPGQVDQVIMNLALNARDAMPEGGTVTIETANVEPDAVQSPEVRLKVPPGAYVRLTVSDTGTGIAESAMEHLFEPFFTTKEQGSGTGLGLSTVYGIVKQSGGYVFAQSEPGSGATFSVYLPRISAPLHSPAEAGSGGSPGRETVLVVDDEEVVRQVVRGGLEASGYNVVEAADGIDALDIWSKVGGTIDLVVTDVAMPRMGGRELVDRLRASRPHLPVIYTSGHTDDAVSRQHLAAGGIPFLQKPFSIDELTREARRALDGSPAGLAPGSPGAVHIPS